MKEAERRSNQAKALELGKREKETQIKALNAKGFTPGEIARKLDIPEVAVVRVLKLN